MMSYRNGIPTGDLPASEWIKSQLSGAQGNCVEMAKLPSGEIAMRNSRDPGGPALIFTRDEIAAMIGGAREGDFNKLI
jgi:hypothetical protein